MFVALVFRTACQSGSSPPPSPPPENIESGAPGPEDLKEQWDLVNTEYRLFQLERDPELRAGRCILILLYWHQFHDMLMESSYVYDEWIGNDQKKFLNYFQAYIYNRKTHDECRDIVENWE